MEQPVELLDVVALTEDVPEHHLHRGQVGTVVEELAPGVVAVEFSDNEGRTYALVPVKVSQCLKLHYRPSSTASSAG